MGKSASCLKKNLLSGIRLMLTEVLSIAPYERSNEKRFSFTFVPKKLNYLVDTQLNHPGESPLCCVCQKKKMFSNAKHKSASKICFDAKLIKKNIPNYHTTIILSGTNFVSSKVDWLQSPVTEYLFL